MGKHKASDGGYVQRELEEPVQRQTHRPIYRHQKKGERDANEVLQEGVEKSLKRKHKNDEAPNST